MSEAPWIDEVRIPQGRGEVLCVPPAGKAGELLQRNPLATLDVEVLGRSLPEFREELQEAVLGLARKFMESIGVTVPTPPCKGARFILTGHQPVFFHPGIWIKHFLLERLRISLGAIGLNVVVDTDEVGEVTVEIPARRERFRIVRETLLRAPSDVPFEAHRPPSRDEWDGFLGRIAAHLDTLGKPRFRESLDHFSEAAVFVQERVQTLGEFLAAARRRYEQGGGSRGYLEVPLSWICQLPQFLWFFLSIAVRAQTFARITNAHLATYRRRHGLRSPAHPFPDLLAEGELVELPFWAVLQGRRRELFAVPAPGEIALVADRSTLVTLPAAPEEALEVLVRSALKIRPRAITLTMFCRLFIADLFIHGVGGSRYDEVTDAVIRDFWGIAPPPYIVASATLWPDLDGHEEVEEERRQLQKRLLDLRHNPDRHLPNPTPEQVALIEEKWRYIRSLEEGLPRKRRRELTRRIREINVRLSEALREEIAEVEERLSQLKSRLEEAQAATYRGYPYFLFFPHEVESLVDHMG
ncbi:MAG: hypothetical protein QN198_04445 [Armatimonadota bacterium]|nr:hypothetical protein [Armatimonadota bacterium]MDR5702833.1 hypothetical protein [Armatimonadota bacterium]